MATAAALQLDLLQHSAGVVSTPAAVLNLDPNLCVTCGVNARHAGGRLTRCLGCIKNSAERDRQDRLAAEAKVAAELAKTTKQCRTRKKIRPLADFGQHRTARDGRRKDCRSCVQSGVIKVKVQARKRARNRAPEQLARNLEAVHIWQTLHPERRPAHRAVQAAVKKGTLTPPPTCQIVGCKKRKGLAGHHNS